VEMMRCEVRGNVAKLDKQLQQSLQPLMDRQETMEILFEAMERDLDHIKRVMQLQLDCLRGVLNAIVLIRGSAAQAQGENVTDRGMGPGPVNERMLLPVINIPQYHPEFSSPVASVAATSEHESVLPSNIKKSGAHGLYHCPNCERNFVKSSNFNKHITTAPKYCARQQARREKWAKKYCF